MTILLSNVNGENHDFEFAQRGLVATFKDPYITSDSNPDEIVWNCEAYDFLQEDCPKTANASLWRQGQLCSVAAGLYLVTEGVYQVRGLDLANMSIVQVPGTNKIIVIDCLTSVETARKGIELYQEYHNSHFEQEAEICALFYTHCHVDHFGGAQAIVDKAQGDIRIIGPNGFLEHAVSENIYAGVAMTRRSIYQYGEALSKDPSGQIGSGLGQALSTGISSLVAPNQLIVSDGDLKPGIEGLEIICQLTPGTEAPAEVNFFFPQYSALCMAENATHTLHNIQTLRGAPVRDARLWSRYIDDSITLFGDKAEVVFASHHWPTWKSSEENLVITFLSEQRDYYAYLHNETLRLLNDGRTPVEIAEEIEMPPSLALRTHIRGYYGSISHNVKGTYDKYMGWFNGNPAYLWPLPPVDEAIQFVECMGGYESVLKKAQEYHAKGNLRFAATLLDKLVFSGAENIKAAKAELALVYQNLGYGAENGIWRNIYLTGAYELKNGSQPSINTMTLASLMGLSLDQLFDTIAIRLNGPQAFREKGVTIDFMVKDMPQNLTKSSVGWHVRLSNGALTGHGVDYTPSPNPREGTIDLTVWLNHETLVAVVGTAAIGKPISLDATTAITSGNTAVWDTITSLVSLPNLGFNIVTP
ncbi:beta-lactamase-like protein [Trichoderma evansii]